MNVYEIKNPKTPVKYFTLDPLWWLGSSDPMAIMGAWDDDVAVLVGIQGFHEMQLDLSNF